MIAVFNKDKAKEANMKRKNDKRVKKKRAVSKWIILKLQKQFENGDALRKNLSGRDRKLNNVSWVGEGI